MSQATVATIEKDGRTVVRCTLSPETKQYETFTITREARPDEHEAILRSALARTRRISGDSVIASANKLVSCLSKAFANNGCTEKDALIECLGKYNISVTIE